MHVCFSAASLSAKCVSPDPQWRWVPVIPHGDMLMTWGWWSRAGDMRMPSFIPTSLQGAMKHLRCSGILSSCQSFVLVPTDDKILLERAFVSVVVVDTIGNSCCIRSGLGLHSGLEQQRVWWCSNFLSKEFNNSLRIFELLKKLWILLSGFIMSSDRYSWRLYVHSSFLFSK